MAVFAVPPLPRMRHFCRFFGDFLKMGQNMPHQSVLKPMREFSNLMMQFTEPINCDSREVSDKYY
jgi:hypothetical protein